MIKDFYPFEVIIVVVAIIAWYILYMTKYGLHLRIFGSNPHNVDVAGIAACFLFCSAKSGGYQIVRNV